MKFRIGCVPEHFSVPFQMGKDAKLFADNVEFVEHPRGTGSMTKDLRDNQLDMAVALTEGLVLDLAKNGHDIYTLIATYVESPLTWGIVKSTQNTALNSLQDLNGKTFAISRMGSGSHIMSYLLAEREKWFNNSQQINVQFKSIGGLQDLKQSLHTFQAEAFMWEHFMLKSAVTSGELTQLGTIQTPWPCFLIACRKDILEQYPTEVEVILANIKTACELFFAEQQVAQEKIAKQCHLSVEDAATWMKTVTFSKDQKVSKQVLQSTIDALVRTQVLEKSCNVEILFNSKYIKE